MPQVYFLEQPLRELRYRYGSEGTQHKPEDVAYKGRMGARILGAKATPTSKSFPSIVLEGYTGYAEICISCVCDVPEKGRYRQHPHKLVGPACDDKGYYHDWVEVSSDPFEKVFDKLSLECVTKREIKMWLKKREHDGIDPYKIGFSHAREPRNINLSAVRLCVQVSVHDGDNLVQLEPLVSEVILDKKKLSKMNIHYCSHPSAPVSGGDVQLVLLCDKIFTKDIYVCFFEHGEKKEIVWQVKVKSSFIFHQMAVAVKVPPYRDSRSTSEHKVYLALWDSTDSSSSSKACNFTYTPIYTDPKYRAPEDHAGVVYDTKYGGIIAQKRTKIPYRLPPALLVFDPPPNYQFQDLSFSENMSFGVPSDASQFENHGTTQPHPVVERYYSVPSPSQEKKPLKREESCPSTFATPGPSRAMSSFPYTLQNPRTLSNAKYVPQQNPRGSFDAEYVPQQRGSFGEEYGSQQNTRGGFGEEYVSQQNTPGNFGAELVPDTKMELLPPATPSSVCSNSMAVDGMDTYNVPFGPDIGYRSFTPGTTSQSVFPALNPASTCEEVLAPPQPLPSIDVAFHQLGSIRTANNTGPEQYINEFVNSPNIPNFDYIMQ